LGKNPKTKVIEKKGGQKGEKAKFQSGWEGEGGGPGVTEKTVLCTTEPKTQEKKRGAITMGKKREKKKNYNMKVVADLLVEQTLQQKKRTKHKKG